MVFLLDTNAVSDLMRADRAMDARLTRLAPTDRVVTCTIVRGEIHYGLRRLPLGRGRDQLEQKAGAILGSIPCESVPVQAADHYAAVKLARYQKGLSADENDLWIAATALAMQATLVSRDADMAGITGLTVEDWTK